jgi:hypothetical protein
MQTRVTRTLARYHFASLRELAQYIDATPRVWKQNAGAKEYASQDWDLNAGYDGAVEMTRSGWLEGAQRAQKALKAFAPATPQPSRKLDVVGQRVSVPHFLTGQPKNMVRRVRTADAGSGRVLTLAVSVVASAFTSAEAMSNYGVAVAQYVNQLERSGVRVHLIGTLAVESDAQRLALSWTIKSAGQPLNLSALAFAIGHPAMLRRIGFAFMERQRDTREFPSYGGARDALLSDLIDAPAGVVILNGMKQANTHARTPETALAYVSAQIDAAQKTRKAA